MVCSYGRQLDKTDATVAKPKLKGFSAETLQASAGRPLEGS